MSTKPPLVHPLLLALATALLAGSTCPVEEEVTVFPDLEVTGQVVHWRDGPVEGATVRVYNAVDWASTVTAEDGTFTLVVDGTANSSIKVTGTPVRERVWSQALVQDTELGALQVAGGSDILFSSAAVFGANWTGDIWMVRADGTGLVRLVDDSNDALIHPRWENLGARIGWVETEGGRVEAAGWSGAGASALAEIPTEHAGAVLLSFDWHDSGVLLSLMGASDTLFLDSALSPANDKAWEGRWGDFSPGLSTAAIGPETIEGNIVLFQGTDGQDAGLVWSNHPCVDEPEGSCPAWHVAGTSPSDQMPRVSARTNTGTGAREYQVVYRGASYEVMSMKMTVDEYEVTFAAPVRIFDAKTVYHLAWSPVTDAIVATTGSALSPEGLIIEIPFTGSYTSTYRVVYDPADNGGVKAWTLEWL